MNCSPVRLSNNFRPGPHMMGLGYIKGFIKGHDIGGIRRNSIKLGVAKPW